jgi:hypothetical protein
MSDPVKGFSLDDTINAILCEYIWGTIDISKDPLTADCWTAASPIPSVNCPIQDTVTFGHFIENIAKIPRSGRRDLVTKFTEQDGRGRSCKDAHENIKAQLTAPQHLIDACRDIPGLKDGHYHILPSFFRLLRTLISSDINFKLIFRTFGKDAPEVAKEFNLFVSGQHPVFPGSPLPSRYKLRLPQDSLSLLRTGQTSADVHAAYVSDDINCVRLATGALEVHAVIMDKVADTRDRAVLCVTDHFEYWRSQGESDESGKILLVDCEAPSDQPEEVHVFFDDNIEHNRAHIVDVRDFNSFTPIPFTASRGKYLRKVESFLAINDELYFVKELDIFMKYYYPGCFPSLLG